jgi:hypothetical protein
MWAPFVALRMSIRHLVSRHVFSSTWGITEATVLLILATANFWTEYLVLYIAPKDFDGLR